VLNLCCVLPPGSSALQFPKGFRTIQVKSGKAYIRKTADPASGDNAPASAGNATCGA
jgi:hypothetical protein